MVFSTRGKGIAIFSGLLMVAVLGYAWVDGGREPLREIAVPIAVPQSAR